MVDKSAIASDDAHRQHCYLSILTCWPTFLATHHRWLFVVDTSGRFLPLAPGKHEETMVSDLPNDAYHSRVALRLTAIDGLS